MSARGIGPAARLAIAGSLALFCATAASAKTIEEVRLAPQILAPKCSPIETEHAVSIQAATHFRAAEKVPIGPAPRRKEFQSFSCGEAKSTIYDYEYASRQDLDGAIGYVKGLIWGSGGRSKMHPESIIPADNVLIVISSHDAEYFANAFFYGFPGEEGKQFGEASEKYQANDYSGAEKRFRALTKSAPQNAMASLYLGHSLFYQQKYADAIAPYEKARDLAAKGGVLTQRNGRVLSDQLGMAYALSGRMEDAQKHFEAAVRKDPDYPMGYYNLACVDAEMGRLDEALANLKAGYAHRVHMLEGETYPDPRSDDSFKKYLADPKFQAAMKELGY